MPKQPSDKLFPDMTPKTEPIQNLFAEVMFYPTHAQKLIKARFTQRWQESGMDGVPSQVACIQLTGERKIEKWWSQAGFKEWFLNKDEHRERVDYLFALALDTAEQILQDPEAQTSAKVNLIKVIAELGNKMPNKYAVKEYADADIGRMDEAQLRKYLSQKGLKYLAPKPDSVRSGTLSESAESGEKSQDTASSVDAGRNTGVNLEPSGASTPSTGEE